MKTNVAEVDFGRALRVANASAKNATPDTPKKEASIKDQQSLSENRRLIETAYSHWRSLKDFRDRRARARDYFRGYQWRDRIENPDKPGTYITEEDYIKNQGRVPLKQNLIRQMVKNLLGQYRSTPTKTVVLSRVAEKANETEMMTNALHAAKQSNNLDELDVRSLEEFFLSGASLHKVLFVPDRVHDVEDVKVYKTNLSRMFLNADIENIGHDDLWIIGEFHDLKVEDIVASFAKSRQKEQEIRDIYRHLNSDPWFVAERGLSSKNMDDLNFFMPRDNTKARVFEIWEKRGEWRTRVHDYEDATYEIHKNLPAEQIEAINNERIAVGTANGVPIENIPLIYAEDFFDYYWYVKFLTPDGHCLYEMETPYKHREHPYVLNLFPLIDGEVWGLVEDVIDQQRYVNRLITLMDFVISASAKGVLLVPKDVIPEDSSIEEFAAEWHQFNGVIAYTPKPHQKVPEQVSINSTNFGVTELLSIQMKLFQDISGVHEAIQGKQSVSGTPAALYAQQAQNATMNSMDYVMAFNNFKQRRDWKVVQVIHQFYKEQRYLTVSGLASRPESRMYDPRRLEDMRFDTVLTQGVDSPVYRQVMDDYLFKFFEGGVIDVEMLLENSSLPFASNLLDAVRRRKAEMAQGQAGQLPADIINQVSQSSNPEAVKLMDQALRG